MRIKYFQIITNFTSTEHNMHFFILIFLVFHEFLVILFFNYWKKVSFLIGSGVKPPPPLCGPTNKKNSLSVSSLTQSFQQTFIVKVEQSIESIFENSFKISSYLFKIVIILPNFNVSKQVRPKKFLFFSRQDLSKSHIIFCFISHNFSFV